MAAKNQLAVNVFITYLNEKEWIQRYEGWYEGYALLYPSTNNGLESSNRKIKDDGTFHKRVPISEFLKIIYTRIIYNWSIERDPNAINKKDFSLEPEITTQDYTKAYQWLQMKKPIIKLKFDSKRVYVFNSGQNT